MSSKRRNTESGFTLVEILVALAIATFLLTAVGIALYQFSKLTQLNQDTLVLNHQLQNAASALNRDIVSTGVATVNSQSLSLEIPSYTFGQTGDATVSTVTYTLSDGTLVRTEDDRQTVVARNVTALEFSRSGNTIQASITCHVHNQDRSTTLSFYLRPSQQD